MVDYTFQNSKTDQEPLVSVLVPSYNHEKYVIECLESIKKLTYRRLELIVSDDCSRDSTFTLTEEWAERNVDRFERTLVVRQQKNLGIVGNLQFLFNSAQGDYLVYIASDDIYVETAIEGRLKVLQTNTDVDAVFGDVQFISMDGTLILDKFTPKRIVRELMCKELLCSSIVLNHTPPGGGMMLRRNAVLEGGSLGTLPAGLKIEDHYIYTRLAARGKMRLVDEIVAKYRKVPGSLCRPLSLSDADRRNKMRESIITDELNEHLVSGFDRFAVKWKIARVRLELHKDNIGFYRFRRFILRCVVTLLRARLSIHSLILKG